MKHIHQTFGSALVRALSALIYTPAPGAAVGTATAPTRTPNDTAHGSRPVAGSGVGEARSSPLTGHSSRGKANGLNMGTRSGANSDVNRPRSGATQDGR
jgi:hypothetical protein